MSTWVGSGLVTLGVIFSVIGSIGVIRFPDFYSRAHAASKPDTLGLMLTVFGLAVIERSLPAERQTPANCRFRGPR